MFETLKYKREIENMKTDIEFLEEVIKVSKQREESLRHIAKLARYQQERAQKRLSEALAVLKSSGDLCDLCRNRENEACTGQSCTECREECPCKFCESVSGFEFKEDKK